jgi:CYTH domain
MTSPKAMTHTLTDEQLGELLELMADADSVELKVTVPESDQYSVAAALGMDPLEAQIRQVYFFDTPDLSLNQHGVVLRARRVRGKSGDCAVKLRPLTPRTLSKRERKSFGFTVELDAMPGGYVCSGTMKRSVGNMDVRQVVAGTRPLSALFSAKQRAFLSQHAPVGLALDKLSVLGRSWCSS